MGKYFNVENAVVIEQAETAGACADFLLGAAAGAKIGSSFWWFGSVAAPITIVSSILVGGTVGAVGGSNLGKVIVSQLNV